MYFLTDYSAPCTSSPCLNGGVCYNDGHNFACECQPGYVGVTCNQVHYFTILIIREKSKNMSLCF